MMTPQSRTEAPSDLQHAVEQFLYREAALLDAWRLDEWAALLTPDAQYEVPSTDMPAGDPAHNLMLLADNHERILARVKRLNSRKAHREFPYSRTRRFISNVQILAGDADELRVTANFCVWRMRAGAVNPYIGRYIYRLSADGETFRIRYRRAELDLESLNPHGTLSIIL
jgi:p-cumate 2,3-dioxygenase beta subunit